MCNFDTFCFLHSYKISTSLKRRYKTQALCVGRHHGVAGFEIMAHRPHTQLPADYKQYLTNIGPTAFWDITPWHIHLHLHGLPIFPKMVDETRSQYLVNTSSPLHHPSQLSLRLPDHTPCSLHHPHPAPIHCLFNPLNPELNPICYLLAILAAHHFLHVSRIRVKLLTLRWLMS